MPSPESGPDKRPACCDPRAAWFSVFVRSVYSAFAAQRIEMEETSIVSLDASMHLARLSKHHQKLVLEEHIVLRIVSTNDTIATNEQRSSDTGPSLARKMVSPTPGLNVE